MATVEDKIQRIISKLEANTSLKNLVPGTTMHSLVESVAFENMKIESAQELLEMKNSIALAVGVDLDRIGESVFGLKRRGSIAPTVSSDMKLLKFYVTAGTFGTINSGKDINVQAGTIIEGAIPSGYLRFAVKESIVLPFDAAEMYIDAVIVSGPNDVIPANSLSKHNVTSYSDVANNSLKVTNLGTIATGRPEESDDNYRYRINTALQTFVTSNYFGVHSAITALPGISDVAVYSADNGGGTFTVYVKSITPLASSQLLEDVKKVVYQCVPPWANFQVTGPSYIGVKVNVTVTMTSLGSASNQETIKQQVINTISLFINNIQSRSFDVKEIENVVIGSNPNILNAVVTDATIYRGETFRQASIVDLEDDASRFVNVSTNEALIVEPIVNAITVSLQ